MKTLFMVFALDSGRNYTIKLADAKNDLARANVEPFMQSCVDKQAFVVGTATVDDIVEAYLQEVTESKLI